MGNIVGFSFQSFPNKPCVYCMLDPRARQCSNFGIFIKLSAYFSVLPRCLITFIFLYIRIYVVFFKILLCQLRIKKLAPQSTMPVLCLFRVVSLCAYFICSICFLRFSSGRSPRPCRAHSVSRRDDVVRRCYSRYFPL